MSQVTWLSPHNEEHDLSSTHTWVEPFPPPQVGSGVRGFQPSSHHCRSSRRTDRQTDRPRDGEKMSD